MKRKTTRKIELVLKELETGIDAEMQKMLSANTRCVMTLALTDTSDFAECLAAFRPTPQVRLIEWATEHIVNEFGRAYDAAAYPHLGAPGGPMDSFDDHRVRTITMQFGTRIGKTFFGQCALLKQAATDPGPMLFASSQESLAKRVLSRTYKMIHQRQILNSMMLKPHLKDQRQDLIEFRECNIACAWAKSASTLGDLSAKVSHANEIDKWEHVSTSKEAHPLELFADRHKDFQSVRKEIYEGTPTIKGRSAIERKRLAGWNCHYWVPCPSCKGYQTLEFSDGATTGDEFELRHGIHFARREDGKHDSDIARQTAKYKCRHCGELATNHRRAWMMRRGVWCPEGCEVDGVVALAITEASIQNGLPTWEWTGWKDAEWITGEPTRGGQDASYHMSSLYALALDWGDIAAKFVDTKENAAMFRNFVNQWLAQTWEIHERQQSWEDLGGRLIVNIPRKVVPSGFSVVTIGIDKQGAHGGFYVYVVEAWNADHSSHTMDYGHCDDEIELRAIIAKKWTCEGGGQVKASRVLIDSGYRTADVYQLCRTFSSRHVLPCKGASFALGALYQKKPLPKKSAFPGQMIVWVDSPSTQEWIDKQLHTLKPGDTGAASLFHDAIGSHQDFLEQMLNDALDVSLDRTNNIHEEWKRIDTSIPNDLRDARRYAYIAMMLEARGNRRVFKVRPDKPLPRLSLDGKRKRKRDDDDKPSLAGPR